LSNQLTFGRFDTPMTVLAREAEVVRFLNPGGYERKSELDEALLPPLQAAIADPAPRKLIIVHTLGSHWNYAYRHPPSFERWTPSLRGANVPVTDSTQASNELFNDQLRRDGPVTRPMHKDPRWAAEIGNSYDNSILYTDWLLSRFIASVKAAGPALSTLVYVSDHGENLVSTACGKSMHGSNTEHDYRVPMLVWYADGFAARHPDMVKRLREHRAAKLTLENLFHTLVDLGGLRYAGHRPERSIVSGELRALPRYVNADGWIDYDLARPVGGCREITLEAPHAGP
jgi:glucan phosphoethanolaminetransferase (alkaline phosphatase superfamily)